MTQAISRRPTTSPCPYHRHQRCHPASAEWQGEPGRSAEQVLTRWRATPWVTVMTWTARSPSSGSAGITGWRPRVSNDAVRNRSCARSSTGCRKRDCRATGSTTSSLARPMNSLPPDPLDHGQQDRSSTARLPGSLAGAALQYRSWPGGPGQHRACRSSRLGFPVLVGEAICAPAAVIWAMLLACYIAKWLLTPTHAAAEWGHPVDSSFVGPAGVATMLIANAALPYSHGIALVFTASEPCSPWDTLFGRRAQPGRATAAMRRPPVRSTFRPSRDRLSRARSPRAGGTGSASGAGTAMMAVDDTATTTTGATA